MKHIVLKTNYPITGINSIYPTNAADGNIANEAEAVGGKAQEELEYTIYATIKDKSPYEKAKSVIYQLQSAQRGKIPGSQFRIRKAVDLDPSTMQPKGEPQFIFTGKAPITDGGLKEKNLGADQEMLDIFIVATQGYVEKIRYEIPSAGVPGDNPWQVDTFKDKEGNDTDYVKIDLELPPGSDWQLDPSKIPFDLEDIAITFKGKVIYGSQERVDWLFDNVINKKVG